MLYHWSVACIAVSHQKINVDQKINLNSNHSTGMNSRATQSKFGCPRMSHYASHYHYGSQSIACSGQWECWTGRPQPVNCINLHKHRAPYCTAEWTYCLFPILCSNVVQFSSIGISKFVQNGGWLFTYHEFSIKCHWLTKMRN
mgnify:CR=1 FL=1